MLSVVILARNEEKNIIRCLQSVAFASEIIVIDDESTDKTAEIARKHGATVYTRSLKKDFSSQRAFGATKAVNDWIFFIDADEVVSAELREEICAILQDETKETKEEKDKNSTSYYIRRKDHFWGKPVIHGELSTAYTKGFIRLIKKGAGEWRGEVHETFLPYGGTASLQGYLDHYPHPTITAFLQEINHYSTLRCEELYQGGHNVSVVEIILYPIGKFMYTYFIKMGFRDGAPGFVYSFMMSFHSFLVRAKLYQKIVNKE